MSGELNDANSVAVFVYLGALAASSMGNIKVSRAPATFFRLICFKSFNTAYKLCQ